jgi:hypothetical protein
LKARVTNWEFVSNQREIQPFFEAISIACIAPMRSARKDLKNHKIMHIWERGPYRMVASKRSIEDHQKRGRFPRNNLVIKENIAEFMRHDWYILGKWK